MTPVNTQSSAARSGPAGVNQAYGAPNPRLRRAWAVIGWVLVLHTILLSLRPLPAAFAVGNLDKLMHVLTYATLTLWFIQIAPAERWSRIALWFVGMGVAIEIAQGRTGYRYFSFADMMANATGIVTALLAARCGLSNLLIRCERVLARRVPALGRSPVDPETGPAVRDEG
ncbi:MAG: VanZ family protein [Gammaproteobacteria bacterium]